MGDLKAEMSTAIILITHDLGLIAESAARAVVMYAGKVVEAADVIRIFEAPLHPYTAGLLQSIPRIDQRKTKKERLMEIKGVVPEPKINNTGRTFAVPSPEVVGLEKN
jgi:peptide/nickel transport system ATP-binding protein